MLTGALVVLVPALALLQYRWVGQLSDAERERMQHNLHNAALQFQDSFNGELARAFLHLQVDSAVVRDRAWERYAERHAAWASMTAYPGLIAGVYLIDAHGGDVRLRRWDPEGRTFNAADWTGPLASARPQFAGELAAFAEGRRPGFEATRFYADEALLVAPLINVHVVPPRETDVHRLVSIFGFTVLQLNMPLIAQQLLPALAQRHFSRTDGNAYRVTVIDAENPSRIVYRSSSTAPTDPSRADVNVSIFNAHRDPVMFFARGAREIRDKRNLFVSVFRERRGDDADTTVRRRVATAEPGRWRLLAQHERGSLEAAVGGMRQRNLLVSFGILMLMAMSVGLLTLSSRRAHRLAEQQMEFVAGVSHELRTPIAVIRSAAENLAHGVVGDPERVRRYGDAMLIEARRLGEMVERVLQFAGIDSRRRMSRMPLAVEPLIQEAIDSARPAGSEGFLIERHIADGLPPVAGEASALRSAIENLLANAMKYGGTDRWIGVRADAGPDRREVRVTIEDHGRGIAAADLPHVFDPFYRGADAISRRIQGSGLGLALVRRIAETHGGRVTVVTREGSGSAFTLHLPAAASTPDEVPLRSPNEAAAG